MGNDRAGYVLGISGGVDSYVAGRLAQLACEQVRSAGGDATFIAVRLPYHIQADEVDAQKSLELINPDEIRTVNIGGGVDEIWVSCSASDALQGMNCHGAEYHKGNIKARSRMLVQYAIAGARNMLVLGTDHAAEAVVGFFTKFGDGACDLAPLSGLPKRRVRQIAMYLGAPVELAYKVPTADLESNKLLVPDEMALGLTYDQIDNYLEGLSVPREVEQKY